MSDNEKLVDICYKSLESGIDLPDSKDVCKSRLDAELIEIKKKEEGWMFLRFYYAVKAKKIQPIDKNEHNLFTWYVLGVCPTVDLNKEPSFTDPELPDIDIDYLPAIRPYLKDDFTPNKYGRSRVCNIASYQTYDIKSALIDMARVLDEDRDEILGITTQLEKMKNDEGDDITFAGMEEEFERIADKVKRNKGLTKHEQLMVRLSDYRKTHPTVWECAKNLVAAQIDWKKYGYGKPPRRKKSMGMHASGLIIAGVNLSEFVPLVVPPGSREKGLQASAWVEGLADTDCSSVGLIKFDFLSLEANAKVAECNRMIMQRHGLKSICALPGLSNWSDTSYLDDPKAMELANAGELKGIFQFDSPGIRKLAKKGGVTSFEDLVAYSSLYRPGCLDAGMDVNYCDRKNGKEEYEIHPLLQSVLSKTYGIAIYQEQIMKMLNLIGEIPLKDCEAVRKAISKKKIEKFQKYKDMFVGNGVKNLGKDEEYLNLIWSQIESWAGYGFNRSVLEGTLIPCVTQDGVMNKPIEAFVSGDIVFTVDENGDTTETEVVALHDHGVLEGYEVTFDDGYKIACTLNHKFLTEDGQKPLGEIIRDNSFVLCDEQRSCRSSVGRHVERRCFEDNLVKRCDERRVVPATHGHAWIADAGRLVSRKIIRVVPVGRGQMYDLEVSSRTHNYLLPNGLVTSNSHAVAYSVISSRQLWQKANYPLEFYASALMSLKPGDERIIDYIHDARKRGIPVNQIDINKSKSNFDIVDDQIYYGFSKIKGFGEELAEKIVGLQPFRGMQDFMERCGTDAKIMQPLIGLRAFGERDPHTLYLYYEAYKKAVKAEGDRCQRNKNSVKRYMDELSEMVGPGRVWEHGFDDNHFGTLRSWLDDENWVKLCKLKKKYDKCVATFAEKSKGRDEIGLSLDDFVPPTPTNRTMTLGKSAYKTYKSMKQILKCPDTSEAEIEFYGFPWKSEFETCQNYKGFTFDDYEIDMARAENGTALPVEVKIISAEHVTSRTGKVMYWKLRVTDAVDPSPKSVSVWEHDYDRFESALQPGNIVRMRLFPPANPYPNYSLESVKPWEMRGRNPYGEDPKFDLRVFLMGKGGKKKKWTDDEDDSYLLSPGRKKVEEVEEQDSWED